MTDQELFIEGKPDEAFISTSHVERQNLTFPSTNRREFDSDQIDIGISTKPHLRQDLQTRLIEITYVTVLKTLVKMKLTLNGLYHS